MSHVTRFHVVIRTNAFYVEGCDDPACPWEHQYVDELPTHYRNELLLLNGPGTR